MAPMSSKSSDVLLARLNHEVEKISAAEHRLARQSALLREQITRLRLGASPAEVRLALKAVSAVDREKRGRWPTDWPAVPMRDQATDRDRRGQGERSL
jgi:hypothetical protein